MQNSFTTLCTLRQDDPSMRVFAAGTSSCGISDLRGLVRISHKFQSCYGHGLLGGDCRDIPQVYQERSPVFNAQHIKTPLLVRSLLRHTSKLTIMIKDSTRLG